MDRSLVLTNLARKSLTDKDYDHLVRFYGFNEKCPTCDDTLSYRLDGETFECDCQIQKLLRKHYLAANIPSLYHNICLDQHFVGGNRGQVLDITNSYLSNFDQNFHFGLGLTFAGNYGTGKTFVMTSILKSLIKLGYSAYFITFDELINIWGASYADEESKRVLNEKLLGAHILGLDELKTDPRNIGGFLQNGLDNVVRHRTASGLPTLITTNMLPEDELKEFPKVCSLLSEVNDRLYLTGEDVRGGEVATTKKRLAASGERRPIC